MQIAQVNIARMLAPIDSSLMEGFVANLDKINALAESSPGFIWRLKSDDNNATSIKVYDDDYIIVNMSVWENIDSLFEFVYRSAHVEIFKRRKEWFEKMMQMHMALWYVNPGHEPSTEEAKQRLNYLREHGETPYAFSFKKRFSNADLIDFEQRKVS